MATCTPAEVMIGAMSRVVEDGELLAQGIATPLVACAYQLAKRTHAPGVYIAYAIGNCVSLRPGRVELATVERLTLGGALSVFGFATAACEILPLLAPREFFRPAQVDPHGWFNNVCLGPYERPRLRLPGVGGIPEVTSHGERVYLYVPRHTKDVFVPDLSFRSGVGAAQPREAESRRRAGITGPGVRQVITDLCVFDVEDGWLRVASVHPGRTIDEVRDATGFPLRVAKPLPTTPEPTAHELRLLREEIDPLGVRELELLTGRERIDALRRILAAERVS